MSLFMILFITLLVVACVLGLTRPCGHSARRRNLAANIAEGTHAGSITKRATAAHAARHLLCTFGATADLLKVAGVADMPLGPCPDAPEAAGDPGAIQLLGVWPATMKMVGNGAIAVDIEVYQAAGGKVSVKPTAAGTYFKVGRSLVACGADNDVFEVLPCYPVPVVVTE